jgi:hypothetical protein
VTETGDNNVNLYYSVDNFATSSLIQSDVNAELLTYSWDTSALTDGTTYRIKVRSTTDIDVYDISNADFR